MPTTLLHRTAIASTATLGLLALVLTGCAPQAAPSSENSTPVAGGTLTYASGDAEPTCLDPHVGGNYPQALVGTQYLESLVSKDTKGDIIPWLAEKWKVSDDGLTWDFTLRDGVKFTDGTPLDAAAIAANIKHVQDPKTGSSTGYLALGQGRRHQGGQRQRHPTHPEHPGLLAARLAQPAVGRHRVAQGAAAHAGGELRHPGRHGSVRRDRVEEDRTRSPSRATRTTPPRPRMPATPARRISTRSCGASSRTPRPATPHCRPARST